MALSHMINRDLATVAPSTTITEAARLMDIKNVGCLLVLDEGKLVGMLTDRDIVLRVINLERNPKVMTVHEAMTPHPETLSDDLGLLEALERVRGKPIRRFPVVDSHGKVIGIFTVDDVIALLGKELSVVADILDREKAIV